MKLTELTENSTTDSINYAERYKLFWLILYMRTRETYTGNTGNHPIANFKLS